MTELSYDEAVKRHAEYREIRNEAGDILYTPPIVTTNPDGTKRFNDGSVFAIAGQHPNEYFKTTDGVSKMPEFKRRDETKAGDTPARFGPEDNWPSGEGPSPVTPAPYTPENNNPPGGTNDPRNRTNPGPLVGDNDPNNPSTRRPY